MCWTVKVAERMLPKYFCLKLMLACYMFTQGGGLGDMPVCEAWTDGTSGQEVGDPMLRGRRGQNMAKMLAMKTEDILRDPTGGARRGPTPPRDGASPIHRMSDRMTASPIHGLNGMPSPKSPATPTPSL